MNRLVLEYRRMRRQVKDLAGLLQLDRRANEIVRRTDFGDCRRPVLLLYGFLSTRRVFEVLEQRLRRDGYCVWSVNLGGMLDRFNTRGIDESARKVAEKVERLYARHRLGPLSIIGHSKGGLIGRYYVARLGGDARVRTLVTLGTPHRGTRLAYLGCATLGLWAPSAWQMTPCSPFIRGLQVGALPRSVRFVSIGSRADAVVPVAACRLESGPNVVNLTLSGVGHRELLTRRGVYELVRRELALGLGEEAPAPGALAEPLLVPAS